MDELLNTCCMEYMATQPDNAFDLIIVDPPYFEVKGEFDFAWSSFEAYLTDVEKWAKELARILKDNGSLLWWGHAKKIAYSQIIIDKYLNLENSLVWHKFDGQAKKGVDIFRSFPPITERILFYSKEIEVTGREFIEKEYITPRNPFAKEISHGMKKYNLREIDFRKLRPSKNGNLTGWCSNIILGSSNPTKEDWGLIKSIINSDKEYEELRQEYEELRRPFSNDLKLTDILEFSQEGHVTGKHNHPTQKPPKLTRALVRTIGKKEGRAFIPFMGSGTEVIECFNFGMDVVGTEIDKDYFDAAQARFKKETAQLAMF